jgi:hypothetical protein
MVFLFLTSNFDFNTFNLSNSKYNGPNGAKMGNGMLKKPVYLALVLLINLGFILTAHEGKGQNPRFSVSGDCVNDNQTGLMWAKNGNLPSRTMNWQGALDYVASINSGLGICEYKDWRLPKMEELESLINAAETNTATWLNTQGFSNVQSEYYWSSSEYAANTDLYAWVVPMSKLSTINFTVNYRKHLPAYVWPVRSGK